MSEPKKKDEKKPEQKSEPNTELPDTKHHYAGKEALKQGPVSINEDALGAQAFS